MFKTVKIKTRAKPEVLVTLLLLLTETSQQS